MVACILISFCVCLEKDARRVTFHVLIQKRVWNGVCAIRLGYQLLSFAIDYTLVEVKLF
jgi:hypothetical protein